MNTDVTTTAEWLVWNWLFYHQRKVKGLEELHENKDYIHYIGRAGRIRCRNVAGDNNSIARSHELKNSQTPHWSASMIIKFEQHEDLEPLSWNCLAVAGLFIVLWRDDMTLKKVSIFKLTMAKLTVFKPGKQLARGELTY